MVSILQVMTRIRCCSEPLHYQSSITNVLIYWTICSDQCHSVAGHSQINSEELIYRDITVELILTDHNNSSISSQLKQYPKPHGCGVQEKQRAHRSFALSSFVLLPPYSILVYSTSTSTTPVQILPTFIFCLPLHTANTPSVESEEQQHYTIKNLTWRYRYMEDSGTKFDLYLICRQAKLEYRYYQTVFIIHKIYFFLRDLFFDYISKPDAFCNKTKLLIFSVCIFILFFLTLLLFGWLHLMIIQSMTNSELLTPLFQIYKK